MDPEEIARCVRSMQISSNNKKDPIVLPEDLASIGKNRLDSCLVCKIFSSKAVNRETFRVQMPRILQAKKPIQIEVIGENIFLFHFASLIDRGHSILDGPWSFFKDMVIFDGEIQADNTQQRRLQKAVDLVFEEISVWVQCHNVPLVFMQSAILRNLGSKLGTVMEVDEGDEGDEGSCTGRYDRIRVSLDINEPLRQCLSVRSEQEQEDICIILLYEKLPNFCYNCGKLGHVQRDCEAHTEDSSNLPFGNWLRASSISGERKANYPRSKSNTSNGSPSADYPHSDEINALTIPTPTNFPPIGTESSREKSETDDNLVVLLPNQPQKYDMSTNTATEKMGGICSVRETLLTIDMQVILSVQKKKWKRMARANSNTNLGSSENLTPLDKGKRVMLPHETLEVSKRPRTVMDSGYIDCLVKEGSTQWRFIGFYGNPVTSMRTQSWQLIRRLAGIHELSSLPWLVGGDFNEILFDSEKFGGMLRANAQMTEFSNTLDDCGLCDILARGDRFTWCNRRKGDALIFARLDRYICNYGWHSTFPEAVLENLGFFGSDHRPVAVQLRPVSSFNLHISPKRFNFEHKWFLEEDFTTIVTNNWEGSQGDYSLPQRLYRCSRTLTSWAGTKFDHIGRTLRELHKELDSLITSDHIQNNHDRIDEMERRIERLSDQEELHWNQPSKRKRRNLIKGLLNKNGDWCSDFKDLKNITEDYFRNLFKSSNPSSEDIAKLLDCSEPVIRDKMNETLCAPFTADEVRRAVFDMHPSKAPGLDGFTALFYQKFWPLIGNDVTQATLLILNEQKDLFDWNATLITLIPRIQEPLSLKDFRPISLCNTCYKILSRAITNRFRPVLDKVIDHFQSAFIPGRLILDNVIVGFECMHWIRSNRKAKTGYAALKLDMSKAYDMVEWIFLQNMMIKLGFAEQWVKLIMRCVTSVTYSFRINHSIFGMLKPSRGLRQGDPLSPYLFVLCAQGLSHLFAKAVERNLIRGVRIANTCPIISHLFLADDSLIFFKATREDNIQVWNCLNLYEKASGQVVNFDKSALTFSPSTCSHTKTDIMDVMDVPMVHGHDIYLGLPTFSVRKKRLQFGYLRERVEQKIKSWSNRLYSTGGREAGVGSNPSYVWRSMLWSREIIQRGLCWRVGNGQSIRAFADPWIPTIPSFHSSLHHSRDNQLRVSHFISGTRTWNESMVRQCFPIREIDAILNIPLHRQGCDDIRFWSGSKNGNYSVKDGYYLETGSWETPPFNSRQPLGTWWRKIWKLRLPPKVRIFMWKASRDIIPTDVNLLSHHIPTHGSCSMCNFHYASTSHCLLFCLAIKDVWKNTSFWYCLKKHRDAFFLDCALYVSKRFNQEEFELFVTLCWAIWRETCIRKHDTKGKSMKFRVDWVYAFLDSVRNSRLKCAISVSASQISADHLWKPPLPDLFRLDVDAGFDTRRNKLSVGAIIRDSREVTIGAHALIICNPGSVLAAEILAIRCGMDLCLQVGVSSVCIYSDSKEAVRVVNRFVSIKIVDTKQVIRNGENSGHETKWTRKTE
ncbi:uncharacterized protein LOC142538372 [Primulina tabacum]|uniref:uncharacterized protein LOC142538372 n=1 Tax=Primulina tabacum TaxID=48773 RepID=UPI003F5AB354